MPGITDKRTGTPSAGGCFSVSVIRPRSHARERVAPRSPPNSSEGYVIDLAAAVSLIKGSMKGAWGANIAEAPGS
jgi:hypothetical protein